MGAKEELIRQAKQVAELLGRQTITRSEFSRHTGISGNKIYQLFDGWRDLCEQAGLEPHEQNIRLEDDDIFSAMLDAFLQVGSIPTRTKFDKHFRYSVDVFKKRGLTWAPALLEFRRWAERNAPDFPYMDQLPSGPVVHSRPHPLLGGERGTQPGQSWPTRGGRLFGDLLNFRGLLHAPVNEQGVVFLFGMVAQELGYVVEMVTTGFPDCEAKRRVGNGRWERVRLEFEFQSRNFRDHGHDPTGCDLVVCWEHNWAECPVEVLELQTVLPKLSVPAR